MNDLEIRLGQFSKAFELPISAVSAPSVQQWIYALKNQKTKKDTAPRTKENMLRQIVSLFNFARRQKYVPAELPLESWEISTPRKEHAPIGIYTPDEIRAILAAADAAIIPAPTIAVFAGLRLAEVSRLDWREARLSEKLIVVGAENAKTAARRLVPINDNLAAWLKPHVRTPPCSIPAKNRPRMLATLWATFGVRRRGRKSPGSATVSATPIFPLASQLSRCPCCGAGMW